MSWIASYLMNPKNTESKSRFNELLNLTQSLAPELELTLLDHFHDEATWVFVDPSFAGDAPTHPIRIGVVTDTKRVPESVLNGEVDDILCTPFRRVELFRSLLHAEEKIKIKELDRTNRELSELVQKFEADLKLADKIHRRVLPEKFPDLQGLKAQSRYLAGSKSGGDFFDIVQDPKGGAISVILTDSSSYGLSSSLLSILASLTVKLSIRDPNDLTWAMKDFFAEIKKVLGAQDFLSLFFGVYDPLDLSFRYLNLGYSRAFLKTPSGVLTVLNSQGGTLNASSEFKVPEPHCFDLVAGSRLILVSDGVIEAIEDTENLFNMIEKTQVKEDATSVLNEIKRVIIKKHGENQPRQDCSMIVMEPEPKKLKLLRRETDETSTSKSA